MKKIFTQSEIEDIKNLYENKTSIKKLGEIYNIPQTTLRRRLLEWGITTSKKGYSNANRYPKEKELDIITKYKQGMTLTSIGEIYSTSSSAIKRVLDRYNVPSRTNEKIHRMCKHNPFKRNDEYSDYFLGLLLTDGCISYNKYKKNSYINLSLSEVDKEIVEKFRDWASPKQKITKIHQKINDSYMYTISISNMETVEWLRRKGNFYNKSHNCKIYVPINWHIFRGIFDGDGGVSTANTNGLRLFICGMSEIFLKQVYNFLISNNIRAKFEYKQPDKWHKNGIYYVNVFKYEDIIKIGKKMYENAHIYIKRKYDKWLTFYENKRDKYDLNSGNTGIVNPEPNLLTLQATWTK